jgi:chromosome segregation ATPase
MNTTLVTDHELIMAFSNAKPLQSKTFTVVFENMIPKTVTAKNITQARKIAREYGARFLVQKVLDDYTDVEVN